MVTLTSVDLLTDFTALNIELHLCLLILILSKDKKKVN